MHTTNIYEVYLCINIQCHVYIQHTVSCYHREIQILLKVSSFWVYRLSQKVEHLYHLGLSSYLKHISLDFSCEMLGLDSKHVQIQIQIQITLFYTESQIQNTSLRLFIDGKLNYSIYKKYKIIWQHYTLYINIWVLPKFLIIMLKHYTLYINIWVLPKPVIIMHVKVLHITH